MAKPAARITDPTSCPLPGHGPKAIASGSPDVFLMGSQQLERATPAPVVAR